MKNTYWFRYFLILNEMANAILDFEDMNFALLINQEEFRFANSQMTCVFHNINKALCITTANDSNSVFDENDFEEIAELTPAELRAYYIQFCCGRIELKLMPG